MKKYIERCLRVRKYTPAQLSGRQTSPLWAFKGCIIQFKIKFLKQGKTPSPSPSKPQTAHSKFQYKPSHKGGIQLTCATHSPLLLQYYLLPKSYFSSGQPLSPIPWQRMEIHRIEQSCSQQSISTELLQIVAFFASLPSENDLNSLHISQPLGTCLTSLKSTTLFKIQVFCILEGEKNGYSSNSM